MAPMLKTPTAVPPIAIPTVSDCSDTLVVFIVVTVVLELG